MTTISLRAVLLGGVAAMSGIVAVPAFAQGSDAIEQQRSGVTDIVVTARRREENLQDTPVSVTAVNSAIIEERGIENFVDISKITPNVKIHDTPGGIGAASATATTSSATTRRSASISTAFPSAVSRPRRWTSSSRTRCRCCAARRARCSAKMLRPA